MQEKNKKTFYIPFGKNNIWKSPSAENKKRELRKLNGEEGGERRVELSRKWNKGAVDSRNIRFVVFRDLEEDMRSAKGTLNNVVKQLLKMPAIDKKIFEKYSKKFWKASTLQNNFDHNEKAKYTVVRIDPPTTLLMRCFEECQEALKEKLGRIPDSIKKEVQSKNIREGDYDWMLCTVKNMKVLAVLDET